MTGPGIHRDEIEYKNELTFGSLRKIDPIAAETLSVDVLDGDRKLDWSWLLGSEDGRVLSITDLEVDWWIYHPEKRRWIQYGEPPRSAKKWEKKYPIMEKIEK